jgi:hypothetical protein
MVELAKNAASLLAAELKILARSEDAEMLDAKPLDVAPAPAAPSLTEHPPNVVALAILRSARERRQGREPSTSSRTQEYLREARSGRMYGDGIDADQQYPRSRD